MLKKDPVIVDFFPKYLYQLIDYVGQSIPKTIFGIPLHHNIVGVNAEVNYLEYLFQIAYFCLLLIPSQRGLVIPLSLVCRSPTVIPNSICKLLLAPVPNALSSEVKVTDVVSRPRINSIASKEESQEQEEGSISSFSHFC